MSSDESEYEIYRIGVYGARPIWFAELNVAQEYAEEQLKEQLNYDNVEWRFAEGDMDLMHGLVDDGWDGSAVAAEITREFVFHDVETAAKWRKKRDRKEQRNSDND